jgi:LPXTG-site transpeptidase (sortase) family protein
MFKQFIPTLSKVKLLFLCVTVGLIILVGGVYFVINQELRVSVLGIHNNTRQPFVFDIASPEEDPINREFSILAPQIGVNSPISKNVDGSNEKFYIPNMLRGVAHYVRKDLGDVLVDGALPGQPGNIFLFGHSQIPGGSLENYQGVFNKLEKLAIGDIVKVFYEGKEYRYKVKTGQVVQKDQVEYLAHTEQETLTLMSCWPLGLDIKRYVVQADRVEF